MVNVRSSKNLLLKWSDVRSGIFSRAMLFWTFSQTTQSSHDGSELLDDKYIRLDCLRLDFLLYIQQAAASEKNSFSAGLKNIVSRNIIKFQFRICLRNWLEGNFIKWNVPCHVMFESINQKKQLKWKTFSSTKKQTSETKSNCSTEWMWKKIVKIYARKCSYN